ncbi:MAG: GntR family transcriptional regulator [Anaerolineae bacterium]|nr:GntR family transcriptional regulator [Anaerolineae bacterium]
MVLPPLPSDQKLSLTERVFGALRQAILSSQIKPREYLIIGEIAKQYQISRTPVREAIIMLEREGWVTQDARRGAKVLAPSLKDILEVIEFQMVLEGYIARRAAELLSDEDIAEADAILNKSEVALRNGDEDQCRAWGAKFHIFLAQKVGNKQINATIEQLQDRVDRVRYLIFQQGKAPVETSAQQHRAVWRAIQERDAARAEELMFHHITWFEKLLTESYNPILD